MSAVFIVSDGDYSDYHIVAVFSSLELATSFTARTGLTNTIEEIELDEIKEDDRFLFYINVRDDGVTTVVFEDSEENAYAGIKEPFKRENYSDDPWKQSYSVYVKASDKDHAVKIASDLVMQFRVNSLEKNKD